MATPNITSSNPNGIGYQVNMFSGTLGSPLGQAFFDAAFAGRINGNKIYKDIYNCDILGQCGLSQWLDEWGDTETDCFDSYTLLERSSMKNQVEVVTPVTIAAYPTTSNIAISAADHSGSGAYVLPQVGNSLALPPNGVLVDITAITHATGYDTVLTVRQRAGTTGTVALGSNDKLFVLAGSEIADCACPAGQFAFEDLPLEQDVQMIHIGDKGELCGDAIDACQWLKIPFYDEAGNVIEERWWNEPLRNMYRRHEDRKAFERLLNPNFGVIPTVKSKGLLFTPASNTAMTLTDIRAWIAKLDLYGIYCKEYGVFAGSNKYSQWMQMLDAEGITRLNYTEQPMNDCKWLNLEWCGVVIEGVRFHIYKECMFSNGKSLGGSNWVYPNSQLFVPMCNNSNAVNTTSTGRQTPMTPGNDAYKGRMLTTVYFRSKANGQVFDNLQDSNGILNAPGGRNTFGTGCREHEWTIQSRFLQELHCPQSWGYTGFGS